MRSIVSLTLTTMQRDGFKAACFCLVPLLAAGLLAGCASTSYKFPLTGDPMVDGTNAIAQGPPRDKVLWQYRIASAAMDRGLFDDAATYLDQALDRVEGALGTDSQARKARGYFNKEASKTFLGEPYERVMAYYYRGILFWMHNDLGNARACFRSAQLQDADTEEHHYASDYALLDYLDGYVSLKLGEDYNDEWKRLQEQKPSPEAHPASLPAYDPQANVLFFVEYGHGPIKYATGQYSEELRFRAGDAPARSARIRIAAKELNAPPYDDLYFQATTRGGRVMDHILANKAVFKRSTDIAGNAALISGVVLAGNRQTDEAGLGLLAAGILAKAISASTTPQADTRAWEGLPRSLSFATAQLTAGEYDATVEFLNANGQILGHLTKTVHFTVSHEPGDKVIYVSDQSQSPLTL